ncbi:hypothetical protein ACIBEJ_34620 [Nonomuraea sp. NPDC050790]|uniref:hypothetical protein n=1 Tax=Nonomuraea sp. NPDC050790 TaxID=3364371 RepID=UPI0037B49FEF
MNELALIQSQAVRAEHANRVDVLDKVKALSLLPDGVHATTELVASYYEVTPEAIDQIVKRNREELSGNGYKVMSRAEFESVIGDTLELSPQTRRVAVFSRRAILNVGQILTGSQVAKEVRAYLLNLEEVATHEQRSEAIDRAQLAQARIELLKAGDGYLDAAWLRLKIRIQTAIGLGEEPEVDHDDLPLYVPDFLKSKGLKKAQIKAAQSWFGRRLVKVALAEGRTIPEKRSEDTASGSVRETNAWTRKDLPLFEEVWDMYYAAEHAPAPDYALFGGES